MNEIERTEIARMEYYGLIDRQVCDVAGRDPSPYEIRNRVIEHTIQQFLQDPECPTYPPHEIDDYIEYRAYDLEDHDLLPTNVSAYDIYLAWIRKQRPDTTVIHLGRLVAKPFYE